MESMFASTTGCVVPTTTVTSVTLGKYWAISGVAAGLGVVNRIRVNFGKAHFKIGRKVVVSLGNEGKVIDSRLHPVRNCVFCAGAVFGVVLVLENSKSMTRIFSNLYKTLTRKLKETVVRLMYNSSSLGNSIMIFALSSMDFPVFDRSKNFNSLHSTMFGQ